MERYEYLETISSGAYGVCYKVLDTVTGQHCAAKGIKQAHEDAEVMRLTLREVKILKTLPHHTNIVRLLEAFRSHSGRVYLVFEYVERSLYQELERHPSGALPGPMVKSVAWQLLHALGHCHDNGIMHRDIKPANILLTGYIPGVGSGGVVKLCDFGFARTVVGAGRAGGGGGTGAGAAGLSSYVMTRWYRPPEVLVGDTYGTSIDVWSYGCTLAELASGRPLFPGRSTVDQLWRIMRCLGPLPPLQTACLRRDLRLQAVWTPPQRVKTLRQRLPDLDPRLFEVVSACLTLDPQRRPTIQQLLQMPYFWDVRTMIANTDLARQLPYAADMACTINFRPSVAASAAAVAAVVAAAKPAVTSGSAPGRSDTVLDASSHGHVQATAASMSNSMTTTGTAGFVPTVRTAAPAAVAVEGSVKTPAACAAAHGAQASCPALSHPADEADVNCGGRGVGGGVTTGTTGGAGGGNGGALGEQARPAVPPPLTAVTAAAAAATAAAAAAAPQQQQNPQVRMDAGATVYDVSYVAWSNSSNTGNAVAGDTPAAEGVVAAAAAEAAQDLNCSTASVGAGVICPKGLPAQMAAETAATAVKAANAAAAATAAATAAAATAATAAAAAAAANAAAAAAASAAASAAAAIASGACDGCVDTSPSLPPPLPQQAPPRLALPSPSLTSAAPQTPCRSLDPSITAPAIETKASEAGGQAGSCVGDAAAAAAAAAAGTIGTPSKTPSRVSASAVSKSAQVVNAASLFQAMTMNGAIASPSPYDTAQAAPAAAGTGAGVVVVGVAAAAAACAAPSSGAGAVAAAGPSVSSYSGGPSVFAASGLPSGGVVYLPMADSETASQGQSLAPRPSTGEAAGGTDGGGSGGGGGGSPRRQMQIPRLRPESRSRFLRLPGGVTMAGGSVGGAIGGASGGSTGPGVILTGGSTGGSAGGGLVINSGGVHVGGLAKLLNPAARAFSSGGGIGPSPNIVSVTSGAVDAKYDSLSRFANDTIHTSELTSELKYIGSPAGAPGLCQFITAGGPMPHRRGPPLPAGYVFLSSPTETLGSIQIPESATGGGGGGTTTGDVVLASGPIPGCTFEFDAYQCTADQPTDMYDMQHGSPFTAGGAGAAPGAGCSGGGAGGSPCHPPARHHSKLWSWALSSLRMAGGLEPSPAVPVALPPAQSLQLQHWQLQQSQSVQLPTSGSTTAPNQQLQQHLQHAQQQPAQIASVAAVGAHFTHTLKWLGSHGPAGSTGPDDRAGSHPATAAAAAATAAAAAAAGAAVGYGSHGGAGAVVVGSCTTGSMLNTGGSSVGVSGLDALHSPGTPDGFGVVLAREGAGGASSVRGGNVHCEGTAAAEYGTGLTGSNGNARKYGRRGKSLITTRSLPGWLFPPLNRGGTGSSVAGSSEASSVHGGALGVVAGGLAHPGQPLPNGPVKQLTRAQQVVLQSSHSYLHSPGDMATNTLSLTCLPPVEEPQSAEPWVSHDVGGGSAATASLRRSPSAFPGDISESFPAAAAGPRAAGGIAAQVAPRRVVTAVAVVAATPSASVMSNVAAVAAAGSAAGTRTPSSTAPAYLSDPAVTCPVEGCSVRGQGSATAMAAAASAAEFTTQGPQPLYGRPYGSGKAPGVQQATAQQLVVMSRQTSHATGSRLQSKFSPKTSSNSGSRSGSRLGSRSWSNSGAAASTAVPLAASGSNDTRVSLGCFPVSVAGSAFINIFSSFRSSASRGSRPRTAATGDVSAGGGVDGVCGGSLRLASLQTVPGGGSAAAAEAPPMRLSNGRLGMSPLSEERRCPMGSQTTAFVESGDGGGGIGGDGDDSSTTGKCTGGLSVHGTRQSGTTLYYSKPSGASSGAYQLSTSGSEPYNVLQGAGSVGNGVLGPCCDSLIPPQSIGPTIPESEENTAVLASSADRTQGSVLATLAAGDSTQRTQSGAGAATPPVPCGAATSVAAAFPVAANCASSLPSASWRLPGALASASAHGGNSFSLSKCKPSGAAGAAATTAAAGFEASKITAAGSGRAAAGVGSDGSVGHSRRPPGAAAGTSTDDGTSSFGRVTEPSENAGMASARSGSAKSGSGLRGRLRQLRTRMRELLTSSH